MKKLRLRIILTAVLSVFLVFASIIGTINVTNFLNIDINADKLLSILITNNGRFTDWSLQNNNLGPETPYENRYFSVKYEGENVTVDTEYISAINDEKAIEYADYARAQNNSKGYIGVYRYNISKNKSLVVFIDCTRNIEYANDFLRSSIFVSAVVLVAVCVVAVILSKIAINPIVESYEKQKQFITNASHELKTPLTIISANNEIIEMTSGQTESTEIISKQVAKMTALVKNLTALSKLQEFEEVANKSKFSISDLVKTSIEPYIQVMQAENKALKIEVQKDIEYYGDKNLINQLLSILLENAHKYSITKTIVSLKKNNKSIVLRVVNDTTDLENGNLDKYFDRFYRSQSKRSSGIEGSGIGLSLAKEIVNMHNGRISAFGKDGIFEVIVEL